MGNFFGLFNSRRNFRNIFNIFPICFFYVLLQRINEGYVNLFPAGGEENQGQGEEDENGEADNAADDDFAVKWGWIANIDAVSETCRCSWDEVWQMTALEFLNIISYRKDKAAREKEELEKWRKSH